MNLRIMQIGRAIIAITVLCSPLHAEGRFSISEMKKTLPSAAAGGDENYRIVIIHERGDQVCNLTLKSTGQEEVVEHVFAKHSTFRMSKKLLQSGKRGYIILLRLGDDEDAEKLWIRIAPGERAEFFNGVDDEDIEKDLPELRRKEMR